MKRFGSLVAIFLAVFVQLVVVSHYPLLGYALEHFALLAAIYVGLRWSVPAGIVFGLAVGITGALANGGPIDLGIMVYPIAGWLAATSAEQIDVTLLPVQLVVVLLLIAGAWFARPLLSAGAWPVGAGRFALTMTGALILAGLLFPWCDRRLSPPRSTHPRSLGMEDSP